MTRPVFQWTPDELLMLADKLEKQGVLAIIDVQDSTGDPKTNESKTGTLYVVVADCIKMVAQIRKAMDDSGGEVRRDVGS